MANALIRCMGGRFCSHGPGTCTATRTVDWGDKPLVGGPVKLGGHEPQPIVDEFEGDNERLRQAIKETIALHDQHVMRMTDQRRGYLAAAYHRLAPLPPLVAVLPSDIDISSVEATSRMVWQKIPDPLADEAPPRSRWEAHCAHAACPTPDRCGLDLECQQTRTTVVQHRLIR